MSLGNYIWARYGDPDYQILETLKHKVQMYYVIESSEDNVAQEWQLAPTYLLAQSHNLELILLENLVLQIDQ